MTQVKSTPVVDRVALEKLRRIAPGALAARRALARPYDRCPMRSASSSPTAATCAVTTATSWVTTATTTPSKPKSATATLTSAWWPRSSMRRESAGQTCSSGAVSRCSIRTGTTSSSCSPSTDAGRLCALTGSTSKSDSTRRSTISDRLEMFIALDGFETEHDALRGALSWRRTVKGLRRLVQERQAGNYRGEATVNCVFQDSMVGKLFDFVTFFAR